MKILFSVFIAFILTGCSTGMMPVYTAGINEAGEHVDEIAGYTKEASVFKEQQVHQTLRNRDDKHAAMYAQSGFKMTFAMQELSPGVFALLPSEITYREEPDFDQQLPVKPSEHPVWQTTNSLFSTIAKYGLIGFGISELSGVLQAGYDGAGNTFHGDANLDSSFNTAGTSQEWVRSNIPPAEPEQLLPGINAPLPAGCSSVESYLSGFCGEIIQ